MELLKTIIDRHESSKTALAKHLKSICPKKHITQAHINNWLNRDGKVPADWIIPCCQSVKYEITPHELSPELYPHPQDGLPEHMRLDVKAV